MYELSQRGFLQDLSLEGSLKMIKNSQAGAWELVEGK
jgi:hypothetical protein